MITSARSPPISHQPPSGMPSNSHQPTSVFRMGCLVLPVFGFLWLMALFYSHRPQNSFTASLLRQGMNYYLSLG